MLFNNCFRYNPAGNAVYQLGKNFQKLFYKLWKEQAKQIVMTSMVKVQCLDILNRLWTHKDAIAFRYRVDEQTAPGYYAKITRPMDLLKLREKLVSNEYANIQEFDQDVKQMLSNCFQYHSSDKPVYLAGKRLEAYYEKMSKNPRRVVIDNSWQQGAETILIKLTYSPWAMEFSEPVDVVKYQIPHYFTIITHPMDLRTVTEKLKKKQHNSAAEFASDVELIVRNCEQFNGAQTDISHMARLLKAEFEVLKAIYIPE